MKISFRLRFTVHFLVVTGVTVQIIDVYNRPPPTPFIPSHGLESAYLSRVGVVRGLRRCSLPTRVRENTCRRVRQNTIKSYAYNSRDIHLTNKYENKLLNFCTRHLLDAFTCVFAALFFLSY